MLAYRQPRIDGKAYLPVSYFVVLVLLKTGRHKEALERAKANLPRGEISVFRLSNVLMLLNGMLRYRHPNFTNEVLDEIEKFLDGLNEHFFQIPEKLAAFRTVRLLQFRKEVTTNRESAPTALGQRAAASPREGAGTARDSVTSETSVRFQSPPTCRVPHVRS
jgi:hypothetical protein